MRHDLATIAPLAMSFAALVVSGLAAGFAYKQAKAQGAVTEIERKRWLEDHEPKFKAFGSEGGRDGSISIVSLGPNDLDAVSLTVQKLHGRVAGTLFQNGVAVQSASLGPLAVGEAARAGFIVADDVTEFVPARFRALCRKGEDEWDVLLTVEFDVSPLDQIY